MYSSSKSRTILFWVGFLVVSQLLGVMAAAAQSTWDGGGDGSSWSDPANWNPDGVPDPLTDVLLDGGDTIQLDVAAQILSLDLFDGTLDGPGDLTVDGQLDWGAGTITGSGVLTVNGGVTFVDGPDKIIGRHVDLFCDATWEHSHIFYDIPGGGEMVHHAGFTFSIVEGPARQGNDRKSEGAGGSVAATQARQRASHQSGPLIGTDPTADITDVYVFQSFGDVVASTSVTHGVSTDIQGTYTQPLGLTMMASGSRLGPTGIYTMSNGTELAINAGTHIYEGALEAAPGTPPGGLLLACEGQTVFVADMSLGDYISINVRGALEVLRNLELFTLETGGPTTLSGTGSITAEDVRIPDGSSLESITFDQLDVTANTFDWSGRNIVLQNGANVTVNDFNLNINDTNLALADDADGGATETFLVQGNATFTTTTPVPPRIFANFELASTANLNLAAGSEVEFMGTSTLAGTINLGPLSILDIRQGEHFLTATVSLEGQGLFEIGVDASLGNTEELASIAVELLLKGELVAGDRISVKKLTVDGGTISGPGPVDTQFNFDPASSVTRATVDGTTLNAQDGSTWFGGHIDLVNAATLNILQNATFYTNHSATNLQLTQDANTGTEEKVNIDGTASIESGPSVPTSWGAPTDVNAGGKFVVQPNGGVNIPAPMTVAEEGELNIGEGGSARFTFNDSQILGAFIGAGTLIEALGADVFLGGTISPGTGPDDTSKLTFQGNLTVGPGVRLVVDVRDDGTVTTDILCVTGSIDGPASLEVDLVDWHSTENNETVVIVESTGSNTLSWADVDVSGSDATQVATSFNGNQAVLDIMTPATASSVSGFVGGPAISTPSTMAHLRDPSGTIVASTMNDPISGAFTLSGMFDGPYTVTLDVPPGLEIISPATGNYPVTMEPGVDLTGADFSLHFVDEDEYEVTSTADSGPGTLRQAILDANAGFPNGARINLDALNGQTISPGLAYPDVDVRLTIDDGSVGRHGLPGGPAQTSNPGSPEATVLPGEVVRGSGPVVILDGSDCVDCDGLTLGAAFSYVEGLQIQNFDGWGIVLDDADGSYLKDLTVTNNGAGGVQIVSTEGATLFGSQNPVPTNAIAGNGGPGVRILSGEGNTVEGARIWGNAASAIDLGSDGPTPNDARDLDAGPNDLQNSPALTAAAADGTTVSGTLSSRPATTYVIEIYGSEACPSSGTGDLQVPLGLDEVTTDANGDVAFTIATVPYEGVLTAIATGPDGSTSEVSDCLDSVVTDVPEPVVDARVTHLAYPNPSAGQMTLLFSMPNAGPVSARVYDVSGRLVRELQNGPLPRGAHRLEWDGRAASGHPVSSGVYFYSLKIEGTAYQGRLVRLR